MSSSRTLDVIVYGYGNAGKLMCEYLHNNYPNLRWGIAGRDQKCLNELKINLKLKQQVSLHVVLGEDKKELFNLASQTKVMIDAAGPYLTMGAAIVEACVNAGANYVDITGEPPYVRCVIDRFHEQAQEKQIKIVNCCGFDCVPADIGVQMVVEEMRARDLTPRKVVLYADEAKGGASLGTILSLIEVFDQSSWWSILNMLNPFYLNPRDDKMFGMPTIPYKRLRHLAYSCDNVLPGYDFNTYSWTAPYVMQTIDTRIVHRSNALQGWAYGNQFIFYERFKTKGPIIAIIISIFLAVIDFMLLNFITRRLMKYFMPNFVSNPKQEVLDHGFFKFQLVGIGYDESSRRDQKIYAVVQADKGDPGYRQTAKFAVEAALTLAQESDKLPKIYGAVTPASGLGPAYRERLVKKGVKFQIVK